MHCTAYRWGRQVIAAFMVLAMVCGAAARAGGDDLLCCGGHDHLWFVTDAKPRGFDLCHHAADAEGPYFKSQGWLAQAPVAMASWSSRVWVVFTPKIEAPEPRREVFTIEVENNPLFGYVSVPAGRLDIAAPLPGLGKLVSFMGAADGPVALITPTQWAGTGISAGQTSAASEPSLDHPLLLQLRNEQWVELPLPAEFKGDQPSLLTQGGTKDGELCLLTGLPGDSRRCTEFERNSAGQWISGELALDMHQVRSLISIGGQAAAVLTTGPQGPDGSIEIVYLRSGTTVPLAKLPAPAGRWEVLGDSGGVRMMQRLMNGTLSMREIEPLTGGVGESQVLTVQPLMSAKRWQAGTLLLSAIFLLLLVWLIKPIPPRPIALPPELAPLPVSARLTAFAIDLLPAGLLTALLLRTPISTLFNMPLVTLDLEQSIPYLLMAGLMIVHSTINELSKATTMGKSMMGARVVSVDGSPPSTGQILVRNAMKCMVLLVPPLAVAALINPNLQGLPDKIAGTLVVHAAPKPIEPGSEDR